MFKLLALILFILSFSSQRTFAADLCSSVFKTYTSGDWRPSLDGDYFNGFRANAPHFWEWASKVTAADLLRNKQLSNKDQKLNPIFTEGIVAGDPHILNFSIAKINNEFRFVLVDLDDGGRAPLIFDLVRFMSGNLLSPVIIKNKTLWNAYVDGITGKKIEVPGIISKNLKMESEKEDKIQNRYVKTVAPNNHFDSQSLDFQDGYNQKDLDQAEHALLREEKNITKTLDKGVKIKTTGGSQGLVRYWFLVKNQVKQKLSTIIVELKEMGIPATSSYEIQEGNAQRIKDLQKVFWKTHDDQRYHIVKVGNQEFWRRQRFKFEFDKEIEQALLDKDEKTITEVMSYIAYYLGKSHGSQSEVRSLKKLIQNDSDAVFSYVKALAQAYADKVKLETERAIKK